MLIRLAALAAALLVSTSAFAESVEMTDPVPGHPGTTYADLVGRFVPGLKYADDSGWTASVPTAYRYPDEPGPHDYDDVPGAVTISSLEVQSLKSGGKPVLALAVDMLGDWQMTILGAFDPDLNFVDAARIDLDRFVETEQLLAISPDDTGLVVRSTHSNAGENYEQTQLVYLDGAELSALPEVYGYSMYVCGYNNVARTSIAATGDGPGFWPLVSTLRVDHELNDECESGPDDGEEADADAPAPQPIDPPWSKTATATYSWSASLGTYVEQTNDIDALAVELGWDVGEPVEEEAAE